MSILDNLISEQKSEQENVSAEVFEEEPQPTEESVSVHPESNDNDAEDAEDTYKGKTVSLFSGRVERKERTRKDELNEIMEAMKVRRRIEGVVQGIDIVDDDAETKFGVYFLLFYGLSGWQIRIPAEEFYPEIPLHPKKYKNSKQEISQREWCIELANAFIGAPIDYLITKPVGDVLMASRIHAMRQKELYHYFDSNNPKQIHESDKVDARVEAVLRDHIKVDIAGVQIEIDMESMGFQFVHDARKEYRTGMCLEVVITKLKLDSGHKKVVLLKASRKELPEVRAELEQKMRMMKVGSVQMGEVVYKKISTEEKKGFYIVSFYNETMRSLQSGRDSEAWLCDCRCEIPKVFGPKVGDSVFVKITKFNEKDLRLYGIFR